jgi:hypothetical protein
VLGESGREETLGGATVEDGVFRVRRLETDGDLAKETEPSLGLVVHVNC